ncbi:hypothetical protein TNCV_2933051 [Trichonephila clavipes]|nr:hypothetical protein TNCV_2933051 [Trichonephila clavipes]
MTGRLTFLEHCISSEKEFPDLNDDAILVGYQNEYDDLVSLKEQKLATRSPNGRRVARLMGRVPLPLQIAFLPCTSQSQDKSKAHLPIGRENWSIEILCMILGRLDGPC